MSGSASFGRCSGNRIRRALYVQRSGEAVGIVVTGSNWRRKWPAAGFSCVSPPFYYERVDDLHIACTAASHSGDSRSLDPVPLANTPARVRSGACGGRGVEGYFDEALCRVPDPVAGVLPKLFEISQQVVFARIDKSVPAVLRRRVPTSTHPSPDNQPKWHRPWPDRPRAAPLEKLI
jgi:hypothetical protein